MNCFRILTLFGISAFFGALSAPPLMAAEAEFRATARITRALTLEAKEDLDFASVAHRGTGSAEVRVAPDGVRLCGQGLSCTGTVSAASFAVRGAPDLAYAISLPGGADLTSGPESLAIEDFADSEGGSGSLNGSGSAAFSVGARILLTPDQAPGLYSGTFTITVDYN